MSDYEKKLEATVEKLQKDLVEAKQRLSNRLLHRFTIQSNMYQYATHTDYVFKLGKVVIATVEVIDNIYHARIRLNSEDANCCKRDFGTIEAAINYILQELNLGDIILYNDVKLILNQSAT